MPYPGHSQDYARPAAPRRKWPLPRQRRIIAWGFRCDPYQNKSHRRGRRRPSALERARAANLPSEIEVRNRQELEEALAAGATHLL
jgi:hypothetical protein